MRYEVGSGILVPGLKEPSQVKASKTNLYIKGLPSTFRDDDILNLVQKRASIRSVKVAVDDEKRCKGYGFIDFLTPEFAKEELQFIQEKNPSYMIKFAKENEKDKTNLYVTNLPKSWTSKDSEKLKIIFEKYGEIQSAFIMLEKYAYKPLGVGFVRFFSEDSACMAIIDLETNPLIISEECIEPLEAKYADKHGSDSRRRFSSNKSSTTGKSQSPNQLPVLTNSNSAQLLTALFDNNYMKTSYLPAIPTANVVDAYNQYMLNLSQYGLVDPYCFLPAVVAPNSSNYYGGFANIAPHTANAYPSAFFTLPPNMQVAGDHLASSSIPYNILHNGPNPTMPNQPFIPSFN